jgi:hypothetical protein
MTDHDRVTVCAGCGSDDVCSPFAKPWRAECSSCGGTTMLGPDGSTQFVEGRTMRWLRAAARAEASVRDAFDEGGDR